MLESKIGLILHNQDGNHKYGFPTKLFEYMQNSLPMVVSDNYYQRKIIKKIYKTKNDLYKPGFNGSSRF